MILADTNVVVRLFIDDDHDQHARSRALFGAGGVHIPLTVVIETEWVLRSRFRVPPAVVAASFRLLLGLRGVTVEAADRLVAALALAEAGLEFPDALHLAATPPGATFVTFDRDLLRRAQALGLPAQEP